MLGFFATDRFGTVAGKRATLEALKRCVRSRSGGRWWLATPSFVGALSFLGSSRGSSSGEPGETVAAGEGVQYCGMQDNEVFWVHECVCWRWKVPLLSKGTLRNARRRTLRRGALRGWKEQQVETRGYPCLFFNQECNGAP